MGDIAAFQRDLRKGMTISEALEAHGLTLKEAVERVNPIAFNPPKNPKRRNPNLRNVVHKRNGHYSIRKKFDGMTRTYGTYSNLDDALLIRDWLDNNGWDVLDVGLICALLGVERLRKTWGD